MDNALQLWVVFGVVVSSILIFDLCFSRWKSRDLCIKTNIFMSIIYIMVTVLFGAWIWHQLGADLGRQFFIGWCLEKTLSLDNVIIMAFIFKYFGIPALYQHRVLFWGIIGVIVLRALVIFMGIALVSTFNWILSVFSVILIVMGVRMLFSSKTGNTSKTLGSLFCFSQNRERKPSKTWRCIFKKEITFRSHPRVFELLPKQSLTFQKTWCSDI